MVKVALTVEGDTDEVMDALRKLALGNGSATSAPGVAAMPEPPDAPPEEAAPTQPTPQPPPQPEAPEGSWSTEHVQTFWNFLAPQARDIYRRVAGGNGYIMSREALLDGMGLTARVLSGRLSSQGHAVRRIRRFHNVSLPHPMSFDSQTEDYRMLPDVADAILRLSL